MMLVRTLFISLALLAASFGAKAQSCTPVETRAPNASGQQPAFPGQTRSCAVESATDFKVTVVASGLRYPWAVEPLPDGAFLVTEKGGNLRIVNADGEIGEPITGLPPMDAGGQGGLLDVALGPQFATDRMIYWSYTEPRADGNATSVARGVLSRDRSRLQDVAVIFRAQPSYDGDKHFGSRLVFDDTGKLFVTLGERSDFAMRLQAQQLDSHMGKIVRINPDGSVPDGNPFADRKDALPEIWTLGHRNIQSAAFDDAGTLWEVEHGARGGDELNRVVKGENYGWPVVAYGEEYSGSPIRSAKTDRPGYMQPVYYWDPVIAPSGAEFYAGEAFPEWRGNLFVGALRGALVRLVIEDGKVTGEEHLLTDRGERIRDVREGPDGALYVVTDAGDGELWKIEPR